MSVRDILTALAWIALMGALIGLAPAGVNLVHVLRQEAQRRREGTNGVKQALLHSDLRRALTAVVGLLIKGGIAALTLLFLYFPLPGVPASLALFGLFTVLPYERSTNAWLDYLDRRRQIELVDAALVAAGKLEPRRWRRYQAAPWRKRP